MVDSLDIVPAYRQVTPIEETNYKVDVDKGALIRYAKLPPNGQSTMAVYMLLHRPGVYLNDLGTEVPESLAAMAGYEVDYWAQERRKYEAMAKVMGDIDRQYSPIAKKRVVAEKGDYRVVEIARGYFNIEFSDGTVLNRNGSLSEQQASDLFAELTGMKSSRPAEADSKAVPSPLA